MEASSGTITNLMIAANCNTVINALEYNKDIKLIAYAAANSVLILDPYHINNSIPKVIFSLRGHKDRINAVQWLDQSTLVSISSDKSIIIWSYLKGTDPKDPLNWSKTKVFEDAHAQAINYLKCFSVAENEHYILTMCSAGTLKLWQGSSKDTIEYKDQLLFGKNLQECMHLVKHGDKHLMMLVGGYDINIHVYLIPRMQCQGDIAKTFKYKFSLLGHMNAIRAFDFTQELENSVRYIASCSQDNYIRIWKYQPLENISDQLGGHKDLRQYESKTSFVLQDEDETKVYNITLESVLAHHQDSVSSVKWGVQSGIAEPKSLNDFCLLSSAFDFTVCVWKPESDTGVWSVESTLGAMQGNKHAYYGAQFLVDDLEIVAYTFNGAMHQWKKSEGGKWIPQLTIKGHFGEVTDLDWDQHQASVITCSQDQTTRLFSQYGADKGWFEIGRPQVHGYDMNTLAVLKTKSEKGVNLPSRILSGGDEKVLRLFEAPYSYVKIFNQLNPYSSSIQLRFNENKTNDEIENMIGSEVKKQPLGLMNKPVLVLANQNQRVDDEEGGGIGPDFDPNKILSNTKDKADELIEDLAEPPVEDVLMSKTLWPEQQKLYGHAFEVFCIATSHQGDCAASASKAKDKKYADIIIWDLRKGQTSVPCCKLSAHGLTVVQLEFSKCDQYLLSCSRDRSWALFKRNSHDNLEFTRIKLVKDAHTRIIWGVSWSHDDAFFATASREKQKSVKVWTGVKDSTLESIGTLYSDLPEENPSATAIRFLPNFIHGNSYGLAVGLETGDINFWLHNSADKTWTLIYQVPIYYTHTSAVRRIKFNERYALTDQNELLVATCANDNSVRLFSIRL